MASGGQDNDLRCPVCTDLFEWPVSLNCGHTFCEKCVGGTISRAKRVWEHAKSTPEFLDFPCPECNNKHPVPNQTSAPLRDSISVTWALKRMADKAEEKRMLSRLGTKPRTTEQNKEEAFTHHGEYYAEATTERQGVLPAAAATIEPRCQDIDDEDNYDINGPTKPSGLLFVTPCHYGDKGENVVVELEGDCKLPYNDDDAATANSGNSHSTIAEADTSSRHEMVGTNENVTHRPVSRPELISNADIQRALICCEASYGKNEEIRTRLNDSLSQHDFERLSISKFGKVSYLFAARGRVGKDGQTDKPEVFIAFRGTSNFNDVLTDLQVYPVASEYEGKFHAGFHKIANNIPVTSIVQKYKGYKIVVCGHSMGGAVAQIVALAILVQLKTSGTKDTNVSCITFGAPLFTTQGVKDYIEKYYMTSYFLNVINQNDPVPTLLLLTQSLKIAASSGKNLAEQINKVAQPLLELLSKISFGLVSLAAGITKEILEGLVQASKEFVTFLKNNEPKFKGFDKVYAPVGWFLFIEVERNVHAEWKLTFNCDQETITNRLSRIHEITDKSIAQHMMANYKLSFTQAACTPVYSVSVGKNKEKREVEECVEFPLTVNSIKLHRKDEVNGNPGNKLSVVLKGLNLSFFSLNDSDFQDMPIQQNTISLMEQSNDRVEVLLELAPTPVFEQTPRFTIASHFQKVPKQVENNEIKKIKARTMAELLVDDLEPRMLLKAFQRGVAQVAMISSPKKRAAAKGENILLCFLYRLEMFAFPKMKSADCTAFFKMVDNCAANGILKLSDDESMKALGICKMIVKKLSTHVKVTKEWTWNNYLVASVFGSVGVAGLATGEAAGACLLMGGLVVAIGCTIAATASCVWNYVYDRDVTKKHGENYRGILRTYIEELPEVEIRNIIQLEQMLYRQCLSLEYFMVLPDDGKIAWAKYNDILSKNTFEKSLKFKNASQDSLKNVLRHMEMCSYMYCLRRILMRSCFVGVVGLQGAGKSTLIRKTWMQNVEDIGFQSNTQEAVLYKITPHMTVVEFPGILDIEDSVANSSCGQIASFFIYVMPFNGDLSKMSTEQMRGVLPFNCPVVVCINKCSIYPNAFVDKESTQQCLESYKQRIRKEFEEGLKNIESEMKLPVFEVMLTDFVDLKPEMKEKGLKDVTHLQDWMQRWMIEYEVYDKDDEEVLKAVGKRIQH